MGDQFAAAVTRQAVAQLALVAGCKSAFSSVLDSLTDVVKGFIVETGVHAQNVAEQGQRQVVNVLDVMEALQRSVVVSTAAHQDGLLKLEELENWVLNDTMDREPLPFHLDIPSFPIRHQRGRVITPDSANVGSQPPPPFVPSFLPPFPPEHAFRSTRGTNGVEKAPVTIQLSRLDERKMSRDAVSHVAAADDKAREALLLVGEEEKGPQDSEAPGGEEDKEKPREEGGPEKAESELFGAKKRPFAAISTAEEEKWEGGLPGGGEDAPQATGPATKSAKGTKKEEERLNRMLEGNLVDDEAD